MSWSHAGLATSTFLASAVELVEAFTIVLAMGLTRGWRSALGRHRAALAALAVITVVAGYALIDWLPESAPAARRRHAPAHLRPAVAAQGDPALVGPEGAARRGRDLPQEELRPPRAAGDERRLGLDWFGFVVTFKGVFLEGLEVVFIVITFGLNADDDADSRPPARRSAASIVLVAGDRRCTGRSRACPRTRSSSPSACCSRPSARSGRSRASASSRAATQPRMARRRRRAARHPRGSGAPSRGSRSASSPLRTPTAAAPPRRRRSS